MFINKVKTASNYYSCVKSSGYRQGAQIHPDNITTNKIEVIQIRKFIITTYNIDSARTLNITPLCDQSVNQSNNAFNNNAETADVT